MASFGFDGGAFEHLPEPDGEEIPSDDLLEALSDTQGDNEVNATAMPLELHLSMCEALAGVPTYGMLKAIQCTHSFPYHVFAKCIVAVIGFWERTSGHQEHVAMFNFVRPHGDAVME